MMLYNIINKNLKKLSLLNEPLPCTLDVSFKIMWLGDIKQNFEVEIRENKDKLGWLYSDASIVFYSNKEDTYFCMVSELKKLAEEVFKNKQYSEKPEQASFTGMQKQVELAVYWS
jgi:hypothetical protein